MKKSNVVEILEDYSEPVCTVCGKKLSDDPELGMVKHIQIPAFRSKSGRTEMLHFYACCKGECDRAIPVPKDCVDTWNDFTCYTIPFLRERIIVSHLSKLATGEMICSNDYMEEFRSFLYKTHPYVSRDLTNEEKKRTLKEVSISFLL